MRSGSSLWLSGILGARQRQDGLQDPFLAPGGPDPKRLGALENLGYCGASLTLPTWKSAIYVTSAWEFPSGWNPFYTFVTAWVLGCVRGLPNALPRWFRFAP